MKKIPTQPKLTGPEMLKVRNDVENALEAKGWIFGGSAGVEAEDFFDADIDINKDGRKFTITIHQR